MKKLKYVKLFENFSKSYSVDSNFESENIGGSIMIGKDLEFNIDLSKGLEKIGVDLEKLPPYVLKIGNEVNLDSNGKIHINDHHYHQDTIKNDVAVFNSIADFIKGIGYEKMLNMSLEDQYKYGYIDCSFFEPNTGWGQ
jgi:hypothetical protein